jgi:YegS/Rv2252/BmrU family lipid kinase
MVIHNPSAGSRTDHGAVDAAVAALRENGWEVQVRQTTSGGDATKLARLASLSACDSVFAVGGDGTANEVVNGILGTNTSLGVLPYGTANVWAKEMGLPLNDMVAAARLQANAPAVCIDAGQAQGDGFGPRAFLLWCGVGFDASITAEIEPQRALKRRLGAAMFWLVGVHTAFTFRGQRARIEVDGKKMRARLLMALISNAQLYGGLVRVSPAASVDDGMLDLAVFHGTGAWQTAWHLLRVFLGWHVHAPDVSHHRGTEISITASGLPVHVDAEPVGLTPVRISIRPKSLRVLVPPTANQSLFTRRARGT